MNWIFQGNPDTFDIDGYLRDLTKITWTIRQTYYADEIQIGDRVFFWRSKGSTKKQSGIIAIGKILSKPTMMPDNPESVPYWRKKDECYEALRVWINVTHSMLSENHVLSKEVILSDLALSNLTILRQPRTTNYKINEEEGRRLFSLFTEREYISVKLVQLISGSIENKDSVKGDIMQDSCEESNGLEFDDPLEEDVDKIESDTKKRKVYTDQGDPEIDSLHGKYKRGRLIIQPDFQRHFVWDDIKSSRLIESALLEIPLPAIYIAEQKDGREYVIDGQQRLTAFFAYVDGKFPDGKEFKLNKLNVFTELNKKAFKELDEEVQDKIRYCKIRTITFKKESNEDLKFEIFERLNSGSVSLNDQELRNCIYRGKYNELIKELSQDNDFRYLLGLKNEDKRMKDVELVLRFAAFYNNTFLKFKPPMRKFLNDDMLAHQHITDSDAIKLKQAFKNTISIIKSLLDQHAFKRFYKGSSINSNGYWEPKKFNASLYDILMYSFANEDKNKVFQNLDSIREAFINLMTNDQEFIDSIELSTSSLQAVTKRFDKWRNALQSIIGISQKEIRCFSYKLKEELFNNDSTCKICEQKIHNIDDAAVDHIEQYWTGGKTIPDNARLTHRYCNFSRPRKD